MNQSFSTIRRTQSPFRSISTAEHDCIDGRQKIILTKRPPLPRKIVSTGRPPLCQPHTGKATGWPVLQVEEEETPTWRQKHSLPDFNNDLEDMG